MGTLTKEERKRLLRDAADTEMSELRGSLPVAVPVLQKLMQNLQTDLKQCDHTLLTTETFLMSAGAEPEPVLRWLESHGGYCDCEVLANVAEVVDRLRPSEPGRPHSSPSKKQQPRRLVRPWGWDLASMPKPWRVANLYESTEPLRAHLAKSDRCTLTFLETALPPGDKDSDGYWIDLWQAKTDLDAGGAARVDRAALTLPAGLSATMVMVPRWVPVFGWIGPGGWEWHIEVRSEVQRSRGDLKEIAALVRKLAADGR
jgi:hypothetical protein